MNFLQHRNTNERSERLPVALRAVILNRTELKRAERRGTKGFLRIDRCVKSFGVAHDERAVGHAQNCRERLVVCGDLDTFRTWKARGHFALEQKRNLSVERQFVLAA